MSHEIKHKKHSFALKRRKKKKYKMSLNYLKCSSKHYENMPMKNENIPPSTPLLYSKAGVCRGIPSFLIFAPKHRLWVLGRTATPTVPTIYVLSKNKKNIKHFLLKNFIFYNFKNLFILHGQVFIMKGMRTLSNKSKATLLNYRWMFDEKSMKKSFTTRASSFSSSTERISPPLLNEAYID